MVYDWAWNLYPYTEVMSGEKVSPILKKEEKWVHMQMYTSCLNSLSSAANIEPVSKTEAKTSFK